MTNIAAFTAYAVENNGLDDHTNPLDDLPENVPIDLAIDQKLIRIKEIESRIEHHKAVKKAYIELYDQKIQKLAEQRSNLEQIIKELMEQAECKTISTLNGTARLRTTTKVIYPDNDTLLSFSKENDIPVNIKELPNKTAIKSYIKSTGIVPEGYQEEKVTSVSTRTNV